MLVDDEDKYYLDDDTFAMEVYSLNFANVLEWITLLDYHNLLMDMRFKIIRKHTGYFDSYDSYNYQNFYLKKIWNYGDTAKLAEENIAMNAIAVINDINLLALILKGPLILRFDALLLMIFL